MFYELEIVTLYRSIGVLGFMVYVGIYALLSWRIIGGDSLTFFAGNTVAAALVLASNFGEFNLGSALIQVFFLFIGISAIVVRLFETKA